MVRHYKRKTSSPEELRAALSVAGKKGGKYVRSPETNQKISETRKRMFAAGEIHSTGSKITEIPDALSKVDDVFGGWLAGLVDGEGCFAVYEGKRKDLPSSCNIVFSIALRDDDTEILRHCCEKLGIGSIQFYTNKIGCRLCKWSVTSRAHHMALVALFEKYPLRTKKAWDFKLWAPIVRQVFEGYAVPYSEVEEQALKLKATKKYMHNREELFGDGPEEEPEVETPVRHFKVGRGPTKLLKDSRKWQTLRRLARLAPKGSTTATIL